ncbi:hypothetical protein [uncultured Maritimibacter sp.]|uniref:hypothetical protein n=1 Tax=uncultured Maritimibacter sp. TaxID=991866 RepID=UPI00259A40D0|nr:hypothetical protein [uncultured Maritimibacter sp.]
MGLMLYDQTTFSNKSAGTHGDCCRACCATILQIDPSDLPHPIAENGEWNMAFHRALRERGYSLRTVKNLPEWAASLEAIDTGWGDFVIPRIVMATGISPRGVRHAVVYDRLAQRMIHDPHPSRAGIEVIDDFDYLGPFPCPTPPENT